jgi:hypothetical protein
MGDRSLIGRIGRHGQALLVISGVFKHCGEPESGLVCVIPAYMHLETQSVLLYIYSFLSTVESLDVCRQQLIPLILLSRHARKLARTEILHAIINIHANPIIIALFVCGREGHHIHCTTHCVMGYRVHSNSGMIPWQASTSPALRTHLRPDKVFVSCRGNQAHEIEVSTLRPQPGFSIGYNPAYHLAVAVFVPCDQQGFLFRRRELDAQILDGHVQFLCVTYACSHARYTYDGLSERNYHPC